MNKQGNVYVVQLMPESLPNRVKVGFSMDMDKRLASFTTICPNAKLLASWKGDTEKERAAINLLAAKYNKVGREVFDVNDHFPPIFYRWSIFLFAIPTHYHQPSSLSSLVLSVYGYLMVVV